MDVIEEQIQAYNARDLERFVATYAAEVVLEDGEGNLLGKGQAYMRERYGALFQDSPNLHARIVKRIRIGKYTIDEEEVAGWHGSPTPVRAVVIYRVEDDKIVQVRMLR